MVSHKLAALGAPAQFFEHSFSPGFEFLRRIQFQIQCFCEAFGLFAGDLGNRIDVPGPGFFHESLVHGGDLGKRFCIGANVVAERTADIPGAGAFSHEPHEVEVVLLTDVIGAYCPAPLGDGKTYVERAFRITGASDELCRTPQVLDRKRTSADRATAQIELLGGAVTDVVSDHLLVCFQLVECRMQHAAGFFNDIVPGAFALLNLLHVRLDRLRHVGFCDRISVVFERFGHDPAHKGRAQRVSFHVLAGDQFCDDLVPGALCSQTEFLHPLDELALRVPGPGA